MTARPLTALTFVVAGTLLASGFVTAQGPAAARTTAAGASWTPPRTPDGQPDIQGVWSNATYTPFERPAELADREFFTAEEAAAYAKRRLDQLYNQPADAVHYDDAIWMSEKQPRGVTTLRTSIIVEPKNGRLPPMTAEGQRRAAERAAARKRVGAFDSAQARSLSERCIIWQHEGPPILPTGYNSNLQIVQGPDYVVVMHEMMRDPRIIPLDGRPHLDPAIRKYRGDSRGRWEGTTLVVETTNFTDKTAFRGASDAQRVIERFTPVDAETIRYEFTVEDPQTWASPWKGEYPMKRTEDKLYEYACHEGNYGIANILRAQRVAEAGGN
jgi:hypothetical protein